MESAATLRVLRMNHKSSNFAVVIEDLCGAQVCGVTEELARRDAKDGVYELVFGIHKLRILVPPGAAESATPAAPDAVL